MEFQTITYQMTDGVAVIGLNRPEVMNALSSRLRAEMLDAVLRVLDKQALTDHLQGLRHARCDERS